ncbi:MAG: iron-containing alcohol dehydrogenase [Myxococcales bacterium]|nr:iron-containing alcohol dehydrogenase [Myxococcales bacterium]
MTSIWSFPTRVIFGQGAAQELGSEAKRLGAKHALLVSDPGVAGAGILDGISESLQAAGLGVTRYTDVSGNPLEAEVLGATDAYRDSGADLIVGVGGGSALDVAKLVRVLATHPPPLAQYDDAKGGDALITEDVPPMIALPTTAGTGSEVGRSGVVTIEATNKKTVIFAPKLMPNVAILDPMLTVSLPPRATAATGFDALTHCIEAYCAKGHHPMADAIALEGVRLVVAHIETAVHDGKDLKARGAMLEAAMMGATAFQKGLGACHSLAHPLSAETGMHHGLANALCLPAVLDFNRQAVPERIAAIARILGARGDDVETLAFECSGAVKALRRKLGLPDGLAAEGISEDDLPRLAELAILDACHAMNPRECVAEDMLALFRASL